MADGLRQQEIDAIILNEGYVDSLVDTSEYAWMQDEFRKLEHFVYQKQPDLDLESSTEVPEQFVLYVSGIDTFGEVSMRSRSDVNILLAVNRNTKTLAMVATPRDFYVSFQETGQQKDKLTHAGLYGVSASIDALERLYSIDVPYYLRMNFSGFIEIIDALGGIDVYSDYDFTVKGIRDYYKGYNHLNGLEALAFARERYSFPNGDYQRAKNQMEVIRAVMEACTSSAVITNFKAVMEAISGTFETNMTQQQIFALIRQNLFDRTPWQITSYTTQGTDAYRETFSMPGQKLYVILPNTESVAEASQRIAQTLSE